jgi:perosamine synthetase
VNLDIPFLPYGRQAIGRNEVAAVTAVLRSNFLTNGPKVEEFEGRFAEQMGAEYAVAVNSATAALHLALRVAGIGQGDRVVTSPNTFVASANCAAYVGATPDFSDIDPVSYNLDANALRAGWLPDTRAVVAVDYAGQPCDLPAISAVARERGALIIEDACHAVGGAFEWEGRRWHPGGHPWADMGVFSFHPVKTMTTAEGGMLVTNSAQWAAMARRLRSHGIERFDFGGLGASNNPALEEKGPWYYEMQDLGYNYRLTDVQCALGLVQLRRLERFSSRRRTIVAKYNSAFAAMPFLRTPGVKTPATAPLIGWHLYTVQIDFIALGKTRTQVMAELRRRGIGTQVLYIPVYLQPWYRRQYGYAVGKCPAAEAYYEQALSLPLYPALSATDVQRVIIAMREVLTAA